MISESSENLIYIEFDKFFMFYKFVKYIKYSMFLTPHP